MEFKKIDGNIRDWLSFWAQFSKIHEDPDIDEADKIEYLIQATVSNSRARQLVESYPVVKENYNKIVEALKSRFGRDDIQIEVYVRELLKLIIGNATSQSKMAISSLYDKLETHMRALETLGVTSDKCSAMLFPLIESCLPEDSLRMWQRLCDANDKRISFLHPFRDKDGIIRLKSSVSNRQDEESFRFPVVLPAKHPMVSRLIFEVHEKSCHVGIQGLFSLLRDKYWILGGRRAVKDVISKCVICNRHNTAPFSVETPPLPLDRVKDAVPFEVTGVDYTGPLYLRSGEKVCVGLFTCAIYRAVHLELTTSLSTQSFMQVLRRFVA
ncbi:hypothetical protein NQ315_003558 [Exocentrus adspersus]|uniref:Integrase zinc-binding domain-containing protein n=1 Tax=Exocentrus adspersus TaxID=1586481 RepID=A0AAV8VD92_9CUCU|nr:hypothetical protein NQ315_003558 [Exocentrus adspersus]